jgi:hypothetical protein
MVNLNSVDEATRAIGHLQSAKCNMNASNQLRGQLLSEMFAETKATPKRAVIASEKEVRIFKSDGTLLYEIPMSEIVGVFQAPARRAGIFGEFVRDGLLRFCTEWDDLYGGRAENSTPDSINLSPKDELIFENLVEFVNQQVINNDQESPYDYKLDGISSSLYLFDDKILIRHRGLLSGRARDKVIPVSRIVSVKFKRATRNLEGYIQFATTAGELTGGALKTFTDENAVNFSSNQEPDFSSFRDHIQTIIESPSTSPNHSKSDPMDQLFKLRGLLDAGIITEEEFQEKKRELMGKI